MSDSSFIFFRWQIDFNALQKPFKIKINKRARSNVCKSESRENFQIFSNQCETPWKLKSDEIESEVWNFLNRKFHSWRKGVRNDFRFVDNRFTNRKRPETYLTCSWTLAHFYLRLRPIPFPYRMFFWAESQEMENSWCGGVKLWFFLK